MMSAAQATMSAVEKVVANAAFSSNSTNSIGQTNRKANHLPPRVPPSESDLSHHNSSDGNSEFEEALKNIKALNGQRRLSDNEAEDKKTTSPSSTSAEKSSSSPAEKASAPSSSSSSEKSSSLSSSSSVEKSSSSSTSALTSSKEKNVFNIKLDPKENDKKDKADGPSTNCTKKPESLLNSESISKLKTNLKNFFSKSHSDSPVEKKPKVFCEDADSDSNELDCDKTVSSLKDKDSSSGKDNNNKSSSHSNHSNSNPLLEKTIKKEPHSVFDEDSSPKKTSPVKEPLLGNGEHPIIKKEPSSSLLGSDEKIKDSFKNFLQKTPPSSYNKMLLKKKDDTNVQSVTSTSDSQSSSKLNKSSTVRGNLFENFESLASPEREDKTDDDNDTSNISNNIKVKEEMVDCSTKTNGQAESKILPTSLNKTDKNNSDTKNNSSETKTKVRNPPFPLSGKSDKSKTLNNICDKDKDKEAKLSNHSSSELKSDDMKSNSKSSSSLHLDDASPQLSPVSGKESTEKNSEKSVKPSKENTDKTSVEKNNNNNDKDTTNSKKRPAESEPDLSNSDDKDGEDMAPVKRSRLDDMIRSMGSRMGISLDAIPLDEDDDSDKDSDSSDKPSDDNDSSDDDEDMEKPSTDLDSKIIRMTEKELAEIVKKEVEKILESKESNLSVLQEKIDELQVANEGWKTRAKELHKQILEITVLQQKSEKRKAFHRPHATRTVGTQVDESKILPSTNQPRSGIPTNNQTPSSKFQSPTVKSLLDANRNPNQASSNPSVMYQSSPGLFVVSSPQTTTTSTAHSILNKPSHMSTSSASRAGGGSVKVIDLTEDESDSSNNRSNGKGLIQASPMTSMGQVRPGLIPGQVVRQVNPVQQQAVPPGTSFLLSTPAGTQIISPTVTQNAGGTRPGVCQYVLTSAPNIRPGSLVTVVPGTQNPSIRPPIVSTTIGGTGSLPQLRPAQQSSSVSSVDLTKGIRPPPPLQSAPMSQRVVSTILTSSSSSTPQSSSSSHPSSSSSSSFSKHPAPLPPTPSHNVQATGLKSPPPKPGLRITRVAQGIVLSWNMTLVDTFAEISNYQLYAYQEGSATPSTSLWKKVGDIKALPLPMACTLTQFHEGHKYHFAVRAVDTHGRVGPFSDPNTINLGIGGK